MSPYERELMKQYAVAQAIVERQKQTAERPMQDWHLSKQDRVFLRVNKIQAD